MRILFTSVLALSYLLLLTTSHVESYQDIGDKYDGHVVYRLFPSNMEQVKLLQSFTDDQVSIPTSLIDDINYTYHDH